MAKRKKDPAAVSLGRKGGKARIRTMTPKQRSEAARNAARARWAGVKAKAVHSRNGEAEKDEAGGARAMPKCAICGAEIPATDKLCSHCGYHAVDDALLNDPGLARIRSKLAEALEGFHHHRAQWQLHSFADAEEIIARFKTRDPEEIEKKAIKALVDAGPVEDPWGVEVLHPLIQIIGAPLEDTRAYVKKLEARGAVRIERGPTFTVPIPTLSWWVECKKPEEER